VVGILAVLIAGLGVGYRLTQAYYFVGRDGTEVAIFRGVNTQFGPLKFFNVFKNTDLAMADLQPAVRPQVQAGINAHNEGDAEQIVTRLHDQLLPFCRVTPAPTPTPTATHTSSASRSALPSSGARTSRPGTTAKTSAPASTSATQSPSSAPSPQPTGECR